MSATTPTANTEPVTPRKPHKWRQGTVALREIKAQQKSVAPIIPAAAFDRVAREILQKNDSITRIQPAALRALQQGAEDYLVETLTTAQGYAVHGQRITLNADDLRLANQKVGSQ